MKQNNYIKLFLVLFSLTLINCEEEFDYGKIINAVKTVEYRNVTQTTAEVSGNVIIDNGADLTERGICYNNNSTSPSVNGPKVVFASASLGNFLCTLTNLNPSTTYYARAYATNSYGTAYGATISFTTLQATIPILSSTTAASSITATTATTGGTISNSGASNITSRGVCYSSTVTVPTIADPKTINGTGIGTFTSPLTGLTANTTYYIRAYATNGVGTAYGATRTFTTSAATIPTGIITLGASSITQNTASSGGTITSDGGAPITMKGVCWSSTSTLPTISNSNTNNGSGINSFTSSLTGLNANTTYYVRAYAINSVGIAYGNTISFTTLPNIAVGQSYQGGIIAYIFVPGDSGYIAGQTHGLIVTTTTQSTGAQWGCSGTSIAGTSTVFGSGESNTILIVSNCTSSTNAAFLCYNLSAGGYSDWYLPDINELVKLYSNRGLIGGFSNTSYWSSSQSNSTLAMSLNFSTGLTTNTTSKISNLFVRAVRRF